MNCYAGFCCSACYRIAPAMFTAMAHGRSAVAQRAIGAAAGGRAVQRRAGGHPAERRRERRLARHAGARGRERGGHRDRPDARLRYRVEFLGAGHRLRGRRGARPDPHQSPRGHPGPGHLRGHVPQSRGSAAVPGVPRSDPRLRHLSLRPEEAALHQAALAAAVSRTARRSAARSASSATMPASSCRSSPARWPSWIATRPNTASASTTTSTPSTCRRPRAPRAVPRVRRSSTSRAAWSRSMPAAPPAMPPASIYRWGA